MIINLRTTNIYNVLNGLAPITAVVNPWAEKPIEEQTPSTSYLYLSKVTDNATTATDSWTEGGSLIKEALVSFVIVAWISAKSDTDEIFDIIDVINEEIVDEWCQKITLWDWIKMKKVTELSASPIWFNIKNRAILTKQYLFTYYAK